MAMYRYRRQKIRRTLRMPQPIFTLEPADVR